MYPFNSGCRNCTDRFSHNKNNGAHGITQQLGCFWHCGCVEYIPSDNLEYIEYLYEKKGEVKKCTKKY